MAEKHPKRPRDLNQWAKHMLDIAMGTIEDREPTPEERGKNASAVARGEAGGLKEGRARTMNLSPEQRTEIARLAAQTRWKKSLQLRHIVQLLQFFQIHREIEVDLYRLFGTSALVVAVHVVL